MIVTSSESRLNAHSPICGQVGGALLPRLQSFGQVIAADESVLDLVQLAGILSTLDHFKPDLIINPAAYTPVDKAEDEPELALCVNNEGRPSSDSGPLFTAFRSFISRPTCVQRSRRSGLARRRRSFAAVGLGQQQTSRRECYSCCGRHVSHHPHLVGLCDAGQELRANYQPSGSERNELRIVADQIGASTSAAVIADGVIAVLSPGLDVFRNALISDTDTAQKPWLRCFGIAFIRLAKLGRFTRLVGFDLSHLLCNAALGFQRVVGVLEPQEIAFRQAEKLA